MCDAGQREQRIDHGRRDGRYLVGERVTLPRGDVDRGQRFGRSVGDEHLHQAAAAVAADTREHELERIQDAVIG